MKNVKILLTIMLAVCLVLGLCACSDSNSGVSGTSGSTGGSTATTPSGTTNGGGESDPVDDGKVTYRITVVDQNNNPVSGLRLQLCKGESCTPAQNPTDESGVVEIRQTEDEYKVGFMGDLPEGYTCEETEFYFEEGSFEMTIVLTAAK